MAVKRKTKEIGDKKMRTFKRFNKKIKCEVCQTNKDKECVLIPIIGTGDGRICKGAQIHLDCLNLTFNKKERIIYQILNEVIKND